MILLLLLFLAPSPDYYVVVFGYNNPTGRLRPAQSHVFAAWVELQEGEITDQVVINWCPSTGGPERLVDEVPGCHKPLKESLQDAKGRKFSYWLLKTNATFFEAARKQRESLTLYKALDAESRPEAVNCIHACSDVAGELKTGSACGVRAGKMVVEHYLGTGNALETKDEVISVILDFFDARLPNAQKEEKTSGFRLQ